MTRLGSASPSIRSEISARARSWSMRVPFVHNERSHERLTGPMHPALDGSELQLQDVRGLPVGQAEDLDQQEGFSMLLGHAAERLRELGAHLRVARARGWRLLTLEVG